MKVLFLSGMYPTPEFKQKGIFCHEQVKALKKLNIDVDVVVPLPFYEREAKAESWSFEGVDIRYLRFFKLPRAYDFHKTGKNLFKALDKALDLKKYDVIHADAALPTGGAAMYASRKYGVPYAVHGHGLDVFLENSYRDYKNCGKIVDTCTEVFANASAVIGVSRKVLDRVEKRVDLTGKAFVAYNGVDTDEFAPLEHENGRVEFISVGNLISLKGHDYTLRAVKALRDKGYDNFHLDLVGRGYLEEELKSLAKELEIEDSVDFHGYIPYAEVRAMMQRADAFVLPSYYEALGCVYLEAMACGLPVIGCRENGIDEIYEDGKHGFLIENKNSEQLVSAMEKLLDRDTRRTMGAAAALLVREGYTWSDSAKSVAAAYEAIAERK